MEGDVITLQDIFLFDNSAGFDAEGRALGTLQGDRAAPEVPREDAAQQRARRPADLRHRHGLPMTPTFRRAGSRRRWDCSWGCCRSPCSPSAPASAADGAVIDHAQPTTGAVRLLVSVPGTDAVDYSGVTASIAGKEVTSHAEAASTSSDVQRTSILAIDTSKSMTGARITEAKKAALAYLATVPTNVQVGVVTLRRQRHDPGRTHPRPCGRDEGDPGGSP